MTGYPRNIGEWLAIALKLLFYELLSILRLDDNEAAISACLDKLEKNFSPSIEGAESHFSNCFDEIDFEQDSKRIVAQAKKLVKRSS